MKQKRTSALSALIKINMLAGWTTWAIGTGILVALDIFLRIQAYSRLGNEGRMLVQAFGLGALGLLITLVLWEREDPLLLLSLPVGIRSVLWVKWVSAIIFVASSTIASYLLTPFSAITPTQLAAGATSLIIILFILNAAFLQAKKVFTRLLVLVAWIIASVATSFLVILSWPDFGLSVPAASLLLLSTLVWFSPRTVLENIHKPWRIHIFSCLVFLMLPSLYLSNVYIIKWMGPFTRWQYTHATGISYSTGESIAFTKTSLIFPRLREVIFIKKNNGQVHHDLLVDRIDELSQAETIKPISENGWQLTHKYAMHLNNVELRRDYEFRNGKERIILPNAAQTRLLKLENGQLQILQWIFPFSDNEHVILRIYPLDDPNKQLEIPWGNSLRKLEHIVDPYFYNIKVFPDDSMIIWHNSHENIPSCFYFYEKGSIGHLLPIISEKTLSSCTFGPNYFVGFGHDGQAYVGNWKNDSFFQLPMKEAEVASWFLGEKNIMYSSSNPPKELIAFSLEANCIPKAGRVIRLDVSAVCGNFVQVGNQVLDLSDPESAPLALPGGKESIGWVKKLPDDKGLLVLQGNQHFVFKEYSSQKVWSSQAPSRYPRSKSGGCHRASGIFWSSESKRLLMTVAYNDTLWGLNSFKIVVASWYPERDRWEVNEY